MNELALFAGAGGGLLATRCLLGWRTVCAVEIEPYRREVLLRRQGDGVLDLFPIWGDVRTFEGRPWCGKVDVVTAGFPCQPWSTAGKREGEGDHRNLWPDTMRIIREVGSRYVLLENVPGLLAHLYFGTILGELAEGGYDCRWDCFRACDEGAPHIRDRVFILGYTNRNREPAMPIDGEAAGLSALVDLGNANSRQPGWRKQQQEGGESARCVGWWDVEPGICRVVDGLACRIHRLAALGDGQVPAVVVRAWRELGA